MRIVIAGATGNVGRHATAERLTRRPQNAPRSADSQCSGRR